MTTMTSTLRSRSWEDRVLETADIVGLIPGLNIPAEIVSGLISLKKKDYVGVALSVAGLLPFEGELAVAYKIARNARDFNHAAKVGVKVAKKVRKFARMAA